MPDNNNQTGRYLTTGEKIRNFTGWAFALAVFLELIALPFYHQYGNSEAEATEKPITITKQTIKPPPTPPPPTPTPPPTPQPHQTPQPQVHQQQQPLKVNQLHLHNTGTGPAERAYSPPPHGSESGTQTGTNPSAPPAPAETPGSCPNPNQEAHTISEAQPTYPESAQEENLGAVEVVVIVTVGPSGALVDATIGSDPSHNSAIEHEALRVARTTTYAPHLVNCKPVTDEYRYLIDFNPD